MSEVTYATREELYSAEKRLSGDIRDNRQKIEEHAESITRLETLYTSLEGLPAAINGLDKTMMQMTDNLSAMQKQIIGMNDSIESLRTEAEKSNEKIQKIDNKSKIDWQTSITKNFWKILSACLAAWVLIQNLVEHFTGG